MAVAEANLAARFNKPDAPKLIDHYTCVRVQPVHTVHARAHTRTPCVHVVASIGCLATAHACNVCPRVLTHRVATASWATAA
jgi:hypothetical protein